MDSSVKQWRHGNTISFLVHTRFGLWGATNKLPERLPSILVESGSFG